MWRAFALLTVLILLAGCGQKGELYRPESQDNQTATTFATAHSGYPRG